MSDDMGELKSAPSAPEQDTPSPPASRSRHASVPQPPALPTLERYHVGLKWAHLIVIATLVVLLDYLLYQGAGGLSYTVAFIVLAISAAAFAFREIRAVPLAFFGILISLVAMRCAWQYGASVVFVGVSLLVTFPIALRLGRINLPDIMTSLPVTCAMGIATWYYDLVAGWRKFRHAGREKRGGIPLNAVVIPLLVCAAFAFIFGLSNPIVRDLFEQWVAALEKRLTNILEGYVPNLLRIMFWVTSALFAGMLLRPAIEKADEASGWQTNAVTPEPDEDDIDLQHRIAVNTLVAVNVLFVFYNGLDAYHLLIRDALPAGYNHSQYAHQGAFWLTVALVMTTIVVGRIFHGNLNFHPKRNALLNWATLWLLQNFVLATWVFLRIHMYVGYNGMTRMRIVALVGTGVVVIGLVLVTFKAMRRLSLTWLVRKETGAFLLACIFLALIPMDYLSWRFNTPNILASNPPRTSVQLTEQYISPEGLATLTPLLAHPDPVIAEGVAALLGQWYFGEGRAYVDGGSNLERWTRYQIGHAWCAGVLTSHEERILALVPDRDWKSKIAALRTYTSRWI